MRCAGTVAAFTALPGRTALGIECCLPVRRLLPVVVDLFVTGFARFRSDVAGRFAGKRAGAGWQHAQESEDRPERRGNCAAAGHSLHSFPREQ